MRKLLGDLPADALLVADAGFVGYDLLQTILAQGHQILMRAGANVHLLRQVGYAVREYEGIVYLWPETAQRKTLPPLILRRIDVVDGRNRRMCLLTSVVDPGELSDAQAITLYGRRWGVELLFRSVKQTLTRRKMLSDSPDHVATELDWSLVGYGLLSLMLWDQHPDKAPAQEGFAAALRIVRAVLRGGADRRRSLHRQFRAIPRDRYVRRHFKKARAWPHKKNDRPCGTPYMRIAKRSEIRLAKGLASKEHVA